MPRAPLPARLAAAAAKRRAHRLPTSLSPFRCGMGLHRQSVDACFQFFSEHTVHRLMPLHKRLVREGIRNNNQLEMRFRARRHIVHLALVYHLQVAGSERLADFQFDGLLQAHITDS